ncbi:hypothetical protein F4824DRAFT_484558 [Ustulina deusta]|nr:hypothetical protein F4824DRAFT_484558 [Ustulina deusta]
MPARGLVNIFILTFSYLVEPAGNFVNWYQDVAFPSAIKPFHPLGDLHLEIHEAVGSQAACITISQNGTESTLHDPLGSECSARIPNSRHPPLFPGWGLRLD